jgi:hypothetical protein
VSRPVVRQGQLCRPMGAQDFADCVNGALDSASRHIIIAGRILIEAKANLEHGEWLQMFKSHESAVERPIPFTCRTGQMLMKIAGHPVLANTNHGSLLPISWRTLYELTKVPTPELERAIKDGDIHPAMERREVKRLASPRSPRVIVAAPWDLDAAIRRIDAAIDTEVNAGPDAEARRAIGGALRHRAHFLEQAI